MMKSFPMEKTLLSPSHIYTENYLLSSFREYNKEDEGKKHRYVSDHIYTKCNPDVMNMLGQQQKLMIVCNIRQSIQGNNKGLFRYVMGQAICETLLCQYFNV